jgi:putative tryptophan/tyrosine transport system substrate-binding protein
MWLSRLLVVLVVFALSGPAEAQQPKKVPRIGYMSESNPAAFRQGLKDLGYIEGKNILIEYRSAQGRINRISSLVAELVQLKVDVLVVSNFLALRRAKQATKTIPIVMLSAVDPVDSGIVDSLARPAGNITGIATLDREVDRKRFELLEQMVPTISRAGVFWNTETEAATLDFRAYQSAARALKIQLLSLGLQGPDIDLEGRFQSAIWGHADALVTVRNPVTQHYAKQIANLAIKDRLPSMFEGIDFVEAGGLMSYTTNDGERFKLAAYYVDKILKGSKPADLPIEQPTKFEFVINLKTAKEIGLTIPPNVLARADKVIR